MRANGDAVSAGLISRGRRPETATHSRELTEPYRRELLVHCYRMLGSFQARRTPLQETMLAAWRGFGGFEDAPRSAPGSTGSPPTAASTRVASTSRRPAKEWDVPNVDPPEPSRLGEIVWLEPYPDALLEGAIGAPIGPAATVRDGRIHLARLRDRTAGPASSPARRADLARCPRLPCQRGRGHARLDRRFGQQRTQAGPCQPAAPTIERWTVIRLPPPPRPSRTRSRRGSSAPGSRPISTRWLTC